MQAGQPTDYAAVTTKFSELEAKMREETRLDGDLVGPAVWRGRTTIGRPAIIRGEAHDLMVELGSPLS
jgi:hypothetical protein